MSLRAISLTLLYHIAGRVHSIRKSFPIPRPMPMAHIVTFCLAMTTC